MDRPEQIFSVAIDGTAASGKTTVAKLLALELNCGYLDTGKLYRAITLEFSKALKIKPELWPQETEKVRGQLAKSELRVEATKVGECRVLLGNKDVKELLDSLEVEQATPFAAKIPIVRDFLLDVQRELPTRSSVVMAGRDIGTVVLPDATLKVFIEASLEERAKRRLSQHQNQFSQSELERAAAALQSRDQNDATRDCAPMRCHESALKLDSTHKTPEQLVEIIKEALMENLNCKNDKE